MTPSPVGMEPTTWRKDAHEILKSDIFGHFRTFVPFVSLNEYAQLRRFLLLGSFGQFWEIVPHPAISPRSINPDGKEADSSGQEKFEIC